MGIMGQGLVVQDQQRIGNKWEMGGGKPAAKLWKILAKFPGVVWLSFRILWYSGFKHFSGIPNPALWHFYFISFAHYRADWGERA